MLLMRSGKPESRTRNSGALAQEKSQALPRLFDLVDAYAQAGQDSKSVDVLS